MVDVGVGNLHLVIENTRASLERKKTRYRGEKKTRIGITIYTTRRKRDKFKLERGGLL